MDSEGFRKFIQDAIKRSDEIDDLAEPSIMDDWIKENDPEQWQKIREARNIKDAISMGMSTGGVMKFPGKGLMGRFAPIRKSIQETKQPLAKDIYNKAFGHLEKENPNFGKVTATEGAAENIGKVIQKEATPENIGKVTNISPEQEKTLLEQVNAMLKRLDEDPVFVRLNKLLEEKKKQKGE
jgi:hypothetical protein